MSGAESEDEGEVYELAKREGKVVVPSNRRTLNPEKPNVSLNLWNLIKNSIGRCKLFLFVCMCVTTSASFDSQ